MCVCVRGCVCACVCVCVREPETTIAKGDLKTESQGEGKS